MASNLFLYWGSGSVPCWRPMIVLEEKGLQGYGNKLISFSKKEHKSDEILKLNPRGQVPTMKDGDVVVCESAAICDYLEYKFADKGTCLLPKDAAARGKVLQRMHEAQNLTKKMMEELRYYLTSTKAEDRKEEELNKKKTAVKEEIKRWDEYMQKQGDDSFIAGKDFTMADVYVLPVLIFAVRCKLDLSPYPSLKTYVTRGEARPSIKATRPPHWAQEPAKDFFSDL